MNCGLCAVLMAVLRQSYKYEMYFIVNMKYPIIPKPHEMRIQEQSKRLKLKTHRETYRVKGKEKYQIKNAETTEVFYVNLVQNGVWPYRTSLGYN